ncbi:MAG: DUF2812 domain-containing protein [Pseudomonadota bacterium]
MKSRFRIFDVDETEAEAQWLNERSAEGLTLAFPPQLGALYWFEEGDAARYVYAIDLKPKAYYRDPERRAFLEETGWQLLGRSASGLQYLRRPAALAGSAALYSDPEACSEFLEEVRRKVLLTVGAFTLIILTNVFNLAMNPGATAVHWVGSLTSSTVLSLGIISMYRKRHRLARKIERLAS